MDTPLSRRDWLSTAGTTAGLLTTAGVLATSATPLLANAPAKTSAPAKKSRPVDEPFGYMLNTSTIRGQNLGIVREVEIAAEAGYHAIEPWMGTLETYVKDGKSLKDLGKKIADLGLTVESAIGFAQWIVNDDEARKKGLEQARHDMDIILEIGGTRMAAPPVGAHQTAGPDLVTIAARYRDLLLLGEKMGVVPQAEVWGFSKTLNKLSETAFVALDAGHRLACILPDVYHLHKGGSSFEGVKLLSGLAVHVFHMNDYPADPPPAQITDAHRVYPGDGIAPLKSMLQDLYRSGFRGYLSLELFNRDYWKQDPLLVARTGLEKMRRIVKDAMRDLV